MCQQLVSQLSICFLSRLELPLSHIVSNKFLNIWQNKNSRFPRIFFQRNKSTPQLTIDFAN